MHTQAGTHTQLADASLTDLILALCAGGHFGVREAIEAALRQKTRRMGPNPSDAPTTRERNRESHVSRPGFQFSPE